MPNRPHPFRPSHSAAVLTVALAATCGALGITPTAHAQRKNPDGVPVLFLTGGQREHHGYRDQALYLTKTLEDTGRYRVTLAEDAAILETPALQKYAILVVNADRRDPEFKLTPSQQQAIFAYVKGGHGYVSIHGADNTPNDLTDEQTREWKDLLGGIYSHKGQPDGKAVMGNFTIKIADKSHPAAQGLDDFPLKDELYSNMQMKDDVKPIATIDYKDVTWPVAWTYSYGDGKVFHTSLGHTGWKPGSDDPLRNPNLTKLVVQGTDWVASGLKRGNSVASGPPAR